MLSVGSCCELTSSLEGIFGLLLCGFGGLLLLLFGYIVGLLILCFYGGWLILKRFRCLTRVQVTEDIKPCYRWRISNQSSCGSFFEVREHRVPFFLTLHVHLIVEWILEDMSRKLVPQVFSKVTLLFYDVVHGFVCGYGMRDILEFWKGR